MKKSKFKCCPFCGNETILLPVDNPWKSLFDSLSKFSDDFMCTRKQPKQQDRKDIFK